MMVKRLLAGARIALVVSLLWTATIVVLRAGIGFPLGGLTIAQFTEWFTVNILGILGSGFVLGAFFAAGLVLFRRTAADTQLTRGSAVGAGALGGVVLAIAVIAYYGFSPYISFFSEAVVPLLTIGTFGAVTGYGVWRTTRHADLAAGEPPPDLLER